MEPITRILLEEGVKPRTLECNELLSPLYRITTDKWTTLLHRNVIVTPEKLELTKLQYLINFTAMNGMEKSGLYS